MSELSYYAEQSVFTNPHQFVELWDQIEPTIPAMKSAIQPLLFHYRAGGDWGENGIGEERITEINLRYADSILARVEDLKPIAPGEARTPAESVVGCCRDWALLFVSLARHHGFAARSRVGFANYFVRDWWIDHTIAEIWDETEQRWKMVDPELQEGFVPSSGDAFDALDISGDRFLPGLDAWRLVRSGTYDPETFVVAPEIVASHLRGLPYLWHNVVHDLAALNRHEMVLWDVWGIDLDEVNDDGAALLDDVANASNITEWQKFFALDAFCVPKQVLSFSPHQPEEPMNVTLRSGG